MLSDPLCAGWLRERTLRIGPGAFWCFVLCAIFAHDRDSPCGLLSPFMLTS